MYCKLCELAGSGNVELMRDNVDLFCLMGHRMPHEAMLKLNPTMIRTEVHFKPGPNDVKCEVWINREVLAQVKQALGERFHPTIASVIRCCMAGDPVIIDGQQAEKLRKLGVKNGADMLATAELNVQLTGQNESLVDTVNEWEARFSRAMAGAN